MNDSIDGANSPDQRSNAMDAPALSDHAGPSDAGQREAQWLQSQKMEAIGQLASGIAHEINTPTQYIGDNLRFFEDSIGDLWALLDRYEALADRARTDAAFSEAVSAIDALRDRIDLPYIRSEVPAAIAQSLEGNARVAEIVRAMKEFAHPGTETKTAVNLATAIEASMAVARHEWKYVADIETDFDPMLTEVPCLPGAFNQVIVNLLVNAAHAIEDAIKARGEQKGIIRIQTRRVEGWGEIRVSDTGAGIPESIRTRVFDPFFTTKGVGRGTGQGLASAHFIIAEKHGGSITFESEVNRGTTFLLRLPLDAGDSGETVEPQ